jgi:hypothetical protein
MATFFCATRYIEDPLGRAFHELLALMVSRQHHQAEETCTKY